MHYNLTGTILALAGGMKPCLVYYRTLAFPLIGISLVCALQVWEAQSGYFVFRVLWTKFLTSAVIATYIILFRADDFVFYNNLGVSRSRLLLFAFAFDFLIWLFLMAVTVMII